MQAMTIGEISRIVGGSTRGESLDRQITTVSHDTRLISPWCLYVAIRGERLDGHAFLSQAAERGAIAALVDRNIEGGPNGMAMIRVADTRLAMGKLAAAVRKQFRGKVIAVAGSNGKTSTKKLISAVLGKTLTGTASPKSFNNDIGVPITILAADPADDFLVLELGTNHHGEIAALTAIAQPDIAVITNCGAEHLEFLGDLPGVRRENAAVCDGLPPAGTLIVHGDDAKLLEAVGSWRGKRVAFGFSEQNDLFATNMRVEASLPDASKQGAASMTAGMRFRLHQPGKPLDAFVPLVGRHNVSNALAALAVARELGVADADAHAGLAAAKPAEMRLNLSQHSGVTLLNDAYNANPDSMRAGLTTLADLPTRGRRIAVLGDMLELGETSEAYHAEIGRLAVSTGVDLLLCVGPKSAAMAKAAIAASHNRAVHVKPTTAIEFPTADDAAKTVPALLRSGDVVLVKASRSMKLEAVATAIEVSRAPARQAS